VHCPEAAFLGVFFEENITYCLVLVIFILSITNRYWVIQRQDCPFVRALEELHDL